MKLNITKLALLVNLLLITGFTMAQEDGATAQANDLEEQIKTKYAQMSDNAKANRYLEALPFFEWLFENEEAVKSRGAYHKNTYIYGLRIFQGLQRTEKDEAKKAEYESMILTLYQKRADNNFSGDDRIDLLQKLGKLYYPYKKDRTDFDKLESFNFYDNLFKEAGNALESPNIIYYMVLAMNVNVESQNNDIKLRNAEKSNEKAAIEEIKGSEEYKKYEQFTETWMLDRYDAISDVINYNITNAKKPDEKEDWEKTQSTIDGFLAKVVNIDCDFVREKMGNDIRNKPEDVKLNKRAFKYMLTGKCTDDPLFLVAAINLYNAEPTAGLASVISSKFKANKNYDSVMYWLDQAVELSPEDPGKQAEYLMDQALVMSVQGKKSAARSKAYSALEKDPTKASDVYTLIGDLYYGSGSDCQEDDPVATRAVYLRAYDMYAKAGNSKKMELAKAQFPSVPDVFTYASKGYKDGEAIKVNCWIGETTTIRTRSTK